MNDFVVVAIFNNQRETMNLRSVLERKKKFHTLFKMKRWFLLILYKVLVLEIFF
jgi:hypothetical protein